MSPSRVNRVAADESAAPGGQQGGDSEVLTLLLEEMRKINERLGHLEARNERGSIRMGSQRLGGSDRVEGSKRLKLRLGSNIQRDRGRSYYGVSKFHQGSGRGAASRGYSEGCGCCGERGHFRRECPRNHLSCRTCGMLGHLDKVCFHRGKTTEAVPRVSTKSGT